MATVRDIIKTKGNKSEDLYSILPDATVFQALEEMARQNIGALLVMTADNMVGILTERDCVRKVDLKGKSAKDTKVREIMTSEVISVTCDQPLEVCEDLMMEKGIRHLPVYDGDKLVGLLSVRDVLREMNMLQKNMLSQLEHYITGGGR